MSFQKHSNLKYYKSVYAKKKKKNKQRQISLLIQLPAYNPCFTYPDYTKCL